MKRKLFVSVIALSLLISGCATTGDTRTTGDTQPTTDSQVTSENPPTETGDDGENENPPSSEVEPKENEMLDLDTYSLENDAAEYAQTDYPWNFISKGEAGYYYDENRILRLFDPESKTVITVCSKPNCKHEDSSCVANTWGTHISTTAQFYYKGYMYCTEMNRETGDVNLWRIAGDGSSREVSMTLFKYDTEAERQGHPDFVINRDTVYYIDNNEEQACIRKCDLGENKSEVIFAPEASNGMTYRMKVYGDFLFFQSGTMDDDGNFSIAVYAYNMQNGETKQVCWGPISSYAVVGTKLFYVDNSDIYSYDLRTTENAKVIDAEKVVQFVNNNQYIVLNNMEVYSLNGEYVCKLALSSFNDIVGMDDEYILAMDFEKGKLLVKPVSELDDKPFEEYSCED